MKKELPQEQNLFGTIEWLFTYYQFLSFFLHFFPMRPITPLDQLMHIETFGIYLFYYIMIILSVLCSCFDSKPLERPRRLLMDVEDCSVISCYKEKNGLCSLEEAAQPNTCSPHWNTMKLSKWIVFCRLSGCGDRGGGWKSSAASHCSTTTTRVTFSLIPTKVKWQRLNPK